MDCQMVKEFEMLINGLGNGLPNVKDFVMLING